MKKIIILIFFCSCLVSCQKKVVSPVVSTKITYLSSQTMFLLNENDEICQCEVFVGEIDLVEVLMEYYTGKRNALDYDLYSPLHPNTELVNYSRQYSSLSLTFNAFFFLSSNIELAIECLTKTFELLGYKEIIINRQ